MSDHKFHISVVTPPPFPTCRGNKVLNKCVNLCQKKPTCEDPNPPEPPCKALCRPMCVCKPRFVNNDEGDCIPLSWCRTCKVGKVSTAKNVIKIVSNKSVNKICLLPVQM